MKKIKTAVIESEFMGVAHVEAVARFSMMVKSWMISSRSTIRLSADQIFPKESFGQDEIALSRKTLSHCHFVSL